MAVAVVERFEQESIYRLSAGPKKKGAIVVRWTLVEDRLYFIYSSVGIQILRVHKVN